MHYAVPPAVTYALLHALWEGALIAIVAAIGLAALERRSAALRHTVALTCLVAMAIAPIVTFVVVRRAPTLEGVSMARGPVGPLMMHGSDWLALIVPLVWALGAVALIVRQLGGWRVVMALDRRVAANVPRAWSERVEVLRRTLGISRVVAVRPAPGNVSPFTARTLRPVIWLPASLWSRLTLAQRDAIVAHELAHVRRRDWLWNGMQTLVEAILFFHPAAWWLGRRVREEREHACDDLAVATCGDPIALAEGLATLEQQRRGGPQLALAARRGSLVRRVSRLLVGAPVRASVYVPIGLAVVLAAGVAIATQVELPHDALINLRVDSSADGPLTPGTHREITADAFDEQRHYRGSMDDHGRVVEIYEEDGEARPIDPVVRAWLDELPTDRQ